MESGGDEDGIDAELVTVDSDLQQVIRAIQKLENKKRVLENRREVLLQKRQQCASEKLASFDWETTDYPWSEKAVNILKTVFKMSKFRPHQLSTINAMMSKQDCILLMPTGGGKSLCYQLPAMLMDGTTLVVSPLISLMEDQIMALQALNVPASMLSASCTREEVNNIQKAMTEKGSSLKLLYVTPEKLAKSKRFMAKLEKMYQIGKFSLLAIDEVHCCSQWGHDFRPDYKFLGIMKRQFPNVPILGLTATATSRVINDVQKILDIQASLVLKASFNRPNLRYEVRYKPSATKDSIDEIETLLKGRFNGLSGIIYCFSIKESEEIAAELRKRNIRARSYHAQLDAKIRSSVHRSWVSNDTQVVVATIAFGMGIDKPDVRFVIHHTLSKSMENFYQESGRAGRDDQTAHCILFYRSADMFRQSTMVFTEKTGLENLYGMVAYCLDLSRCRRAIIAQHFGERWAASDCKQMCDHCDVKGPYHEEQQDVTKQCLMLYEIINFCSLKEERLTAQKLIDLWSGKGAVKLRPPNVVATLFDREKCERVITLLLLEGFLKEEFHFTPYSTISYINIGPKSSSVMNGKISVMLPMPTLKRPTVVSHEKASTSSTSLKDSPSVGKKRKSQNFKPVQLNSKKANFSKLLVRESLKEKKESPVSIKNNINDNCMNNTSKTYSEEIGISDDDDDLIFDYDRSHIKSRKLKEDSVPSKGKCTSNQEIKLSDDDDMAGDMPVKQKIIGRSKAMRETVLISDSD